MATHNFCYTNRCVVVTDEDFQCGNVPKTGDWIASSDYYPRREIVDYDESLDYYDIVMTGGYYEHACIDFDDAKCTHTVVENYGKRDGYPIFYSAEELYDTFSRDYGISKYRLRKMFGKVSKYADFCAFEDAAFKRFDEYRKDKEYELCDKIIDRIKRKFGYEEYREAWSASNGECGYQRIA